MLLSLTKTIADKILTLKDGTAYSSEDSIDPTILRNDYAYFLFLTNRRTNTNVAIPVTVNNRLSDIQWSFTLNDGYYAAELVLISVFDNLIERLNPITIPADTIVYHNGKVYKSLVEVSSPIIAPDVDYNNWEEVIDITKVSDVYKESSLEDATAYTSIKFIYYVNIIDTYLTLAKKINKSCDICNNPEIEELRCLRDKYEAIELASAANDYIGAEKIIESYENKLCLC